MHYQNAQILGILLRYGADINRKTVWLLFLDSSMHTHLCLPIRIMFVLDASLNYDKNSPTFFHFILGGILEASWFIQFEILILITFRKFVLHCYMYHYCSFVHFQAPLHIAAGIGSKDLVEILLKYGANIDEKDVSYFLKIIK